MTSRMWKNEIFLSALKFWYWKGKKINFIIFSKNLIQHYLVFWKKIKPNTWGLVPFSSAPKALYHFSPKTSHSSSHGTLGQTESNWSMAYFNKGNHFYTLKTFTTIPLRKMEFVVRYLGFSSHLICYWIQFWQEIRKLNQQNFW